MCHSLLVDARLPSLLFRIDRDLAEKTRSTGCRCGGSLHVSDYPRKPRGLKDMGTREWARRLSFCCSREGCRVRRTPPSVRFLGRRVYVGFVVVLVSALAQGLRGHRAAVIRDAVGASRRTLERWRRWWREVFVNHPRWREGKARFSPPVAERLLPRSLVDRFAAEVADGMVSLLSFLSPVTVT